MVGIDVVNDELCTRRLGALLYRLSAILIDGKRSIFDVYQLAL
jgi:hypothetical protein